MLAGMIFPSDPVEGRLFYLRFETEINEMKRADYQLYIRQSVIGLFPIHPKGWTAIPRTDWSKE